MKCHIRYSVLLATVIAYASLFAAGCDSSTPRLISAGGDKKFQKTGENKWLYTRDGSSDRSLWAAIYEVGGTKGRRFAGSMKVTSSKPVRLSAILARDGNTPYEGTGDALLLQPNIPQVLNLSHRFTNDYARIKLQFDVVECADPSVVFTVDDVSVRRVDK